MIELAFWWISALSFIPSALLMHKIGAGRELFEVKPNRSDEMAAESDWRR